MTKRLVVWVPLLVGCQDVSLTFNDRPPEAVILRPADAAVFEPGEPLPFCAHIADEDALDELDLLLESSIDGVFALDAAGPCEGGELGLELALSDAVHSLSFTVVDTAGQSASDTVVIVPATNTAPRCEITSPGGEAYELGDVVPFSAIASDDESDPAALSAVLSSDVGGTLWTGAPPSSGAITAPLSGLSGEHHLALTVTDPRGLTAVCSASLFVDPCLDADGDGFATCDGDCDDAQPKAHPDGVEAPDGIDNDCDGTIDEQTILYDDDGDGYTELGGDCDDALAEVHPGAVDDPDDGVDADCSGADATICFADADGDGWGSTDTLIAEDGDCDDPGEADTSEDCAPADPAVHPGAGEIPGDGEDQDCDGRDGASCFQDLDGDGHGSTVMIASDDPDCDDPGESTKADDCDDTNAGAHPGAIEIPGDGVDQDCNLMDAVLCFVDGDGDRFGSAKTLASTDSDCKDAGESDVGTDCDDADASTWPGAPDSAADTKDQDCDGVSGVDADEDGAPAIERGVGGELIAGTDCDDLDPAIGPGATEIRDGYDNDCDGVCDEGSIRPGDVIVTEFMADPASPLSDENGEWFEILNATSTDIRICDGWVIKSNNSGEETPVLVAKPILLRAGGFAAFTRTGFGSNGGIAPAYVYGNTFILGNSGDRIALYFQGTMIDEVKPASTWIVSGRAYQLDPAHYDATDNNTRSSWCEATKPYTTGNTGTPGAENLDCP